VYICDDFYACRECGNRWIPDFKPYKKVTEEEPMAIKGTCKNCERPNLTLPYRGMCGGCYARMKDMEWDSPECKAALARAKQDFNNPDYKSGRGGNRRSKKLSPEKVIKAKTHVKALAIKHNGGDPNNAGIIALIDMKIKYHQDMIGKLNQAKQTLL
jgi:uncharacterized CHY-type Zn-finger protein